MQRKLFLALFIAAFIPELVFAIGKIRGKVTDAGTGEPLVGANVVVAGTQMGAATNVSGEFVILNVPAGTYTLRTTYVGYQAITLTNLRVNNDLTTEANFQLPAEGVTVGTVEIVAQRPLVNKNATNAVRIIDNEFFAKVPARGVNVAIATQPGVVLDKNGNIFIRGGRADEVGYRVEGVGANDILFGGRSIAVTAEAVEQIQVQAGGFNAEYGGANAGLVQTQLRTGSPDRWRASLLAETDRYAGWQKKSLGGYSYGYSDYTFTVGGPLPVMDNKIRFFGSAENTFQRDALISVRDPYNFSGANAIITDPIYTPAHPRSGGAANARPDTLNLINPSGNTLAGGNNNWIGSGTLLIDLSPIQIRFAGSYNYNKYTNGTFFANILNQNRLPLNIAKNGFGNVRISHVLSPTMFYEANFNYYTNSFTTEDPQLLDNTFAYGDSAANAKLGYNLAGNSTNYGAYPLYGGLITTNQFGTQIAGYEKRIQNSLGGKIDFTMQLKQHEVKVGGEFTQYKVRRYNPGTNVFGWAAIKSSVTDPVLLETDLLKQSGTGSDTYGYDIYGNEINSDVLTSDGAYKYFGPRKPVFGAAYVQDKIEFSDIIVNVGLRWDYINPDSKDVKDPSNLHFNGNDFILASDIVNTAKTSVVSPRIGFSFPVTDRTVFHTQYGKFVQQTKLRDSYVGAGTMAGIIKGGFFVQNTWGWGLQPTFTTQYEAGFSQQLSDFASFDISAFYKDIQNQVTWVNIAPEAGTQGQNYGALVNGDFTTAKGIELKLTLRRTNRLSGQLNYTFSDTRATGSNTASTAGLWSAGSIVSVPKYTFPADFNVPHTGSVLLDYRFAKNDGGPILEQLGANLLLTFNSGHSFTRLIAQQSAAVPTDPRFRQPIEPIGSSSAPWFFELDARLDKTFSLGLVDLNVYVYVINLLGTQNPVDAFFRTGDPADDGWLSTTDGKNAANAYGTQFVNLWQSVNDGANSGNWGPPRQIRFGLKLDY